MSINWPLMRLKHLGTFVSGGTPTKDNLDYWLGDIPWVSPKDMKSFVVTETADKITKVAVESSATKVVPQGSLLVVVRSGILRRTIPVAIAGCPLAINQDIKALIPRPGVNSRFLAYYFVGHEPEILADLREARFNR